MSSAATVSASSSLQAPPRHPELLLVIESSSSSLRVKRSNCKSKLCYSALVREKRPPPKREMVTGVSDREAIGQTLFDRLDQGTLALISRDV